MVLFIIGILLTQLLYVISNWRQYRRNDYVRYAFYIFLFIIYIFCIFTADVITDKELLQQVGSFTEAIKRPVAFLLYLVYFRFMDLFLELKEKYPGLHRQVIVSNWLIGGFLVIQVFLLAIGQAYSSVGNNIYFGLSFLLFAISVMFIIKAYRQKNILTVTLLRGSICLVAGAFLTNIINIYSLLNQRELHANPEYLPLFAGILLELFFFNLALAYKIVQQENELTETQQLVIEQLKQNEQLISEQQQTRNKIARDLHDEVGATLSGVTLFSELGLRAIDRNQLQGVEQYLRRISTECTSMSEKINDIVWATQADNDTLEKLLNRLQAYAKPLCSSHNIDFRFERGPDMRSAFLNAEIRNHLYLFCKEAINNAIKYAAASGIRFGVKQDAGYYLIQITDDGQGFEPELYYEGNGLKNMRSRAKEMGGTCRIDSIKGAGTTIELKVKASQ